MIGSCVVGRHCCVRALLVIHSDAPYNSDTFHLASEELHVPPQEEMSCVVKQKYILMCCPAVTLLVVAALVELIATWTAIVRKRLNYIFLIILNMLAQYIFVSVEELDALSQNNAFTVMLNPETHTPNIQDVQWVSSCLWLQESRRCWEKSARSFFFFSLRHILKMDKKEIRSCLERCVAGFISWFMTQMCVGFSFLWFPWCHKLSNIMWNVVSREESRILEND